MGGRPWPGTEEELRETEGTEGELRGTEGTGPELGVRARDCLGFNWGWHGIGAKCSVRRSYLDQVSGGGGEDPAAVPTPE